MISASDFRSQGPRIESCWRGTSSHDCTALHCTEPLLSPFYHLDDLNNFEWDVKHQGPVVQSIVSLTSSLRVISLTVLADSIHNILIFFAEKCE